MEKLGGYETQVKYIKEPKTPVPYFAIVEEYTTCSYLGDYGAGRTIKTFSLLPGEKTTITVRTYKEKTTTKSNPEIYDGDDYIAWLGGQWEPDKRTTNNYLVVPYYHREVDKMFSYIIAGKNTTEDFLLIFTAAYLNSK